MRLPFAMLMFCSACSSSAYVVGDIDGSEFSNKTRAFAGDSDILLVDEADCIDLAWAANRYYDGINPWPGRSFTAIQVSERSGAELGTGVFGLGNDAPIRVWGLVGNGDEFDAHPGREGSVEIDEVDDRGVRGTLSVSFSTSGVSAEFDAEWCINTR